MLLRFVKLADIFDRQIETIKNGGFPAIWRLFYRIGRAFCLMLLLVPFSLPLLIVMRLIRPWLLIRINPIISSRLGHFAANTELYLCERDAGINMPNQRYIDLSFYADILICNKQLARMWRRCLNIWPAWLLQPVFQLNSLFPGAATHSVGGKTSSDRDVNNLLEKTAPHLRFTSKEEAMGRAGLERLGVPVGGKFICLIGRDSTYLETIVNPGGNFDYHNFRDVDINSFILAADALADMGYYVLRMGTAVKARIESTNPKVIDYATSNLRSDFLDIYLGANCFFCISVSTGFDAIPTIFRRPVCYVNMLPIGYLSTFLKDSIAICKRHWLKKEARWLSLREVCELGLAFSLNSKDYLNQNVDVIENTPEEIRELVLEMVARLNGNWKSTPEDDQLQSHFWENYPVYAVSEYNNRRLHGKLNLRYGSDFLRNNSIWLN